MKRVIHLALALTAMAVFAAAPAMAAEVEGTVKSVDGMNIELENGTVLMLDSSTTVDRQALVPGAEVKASYEVKDGNNMVSVIEVRPASSSSSPSTSPSSPSSTPSTAPSDRSPSTMPSDKPASGSSTPSSPTTR